MPRPVGEPPADNGGPDADPESVARLIVLRRLEHAPRTRAQLASTLRERGVPEDRAVRVLDRFEEVGLIDDALFARMWVESRQASRGLSTRALRQELRHRGVADALIDDAVSGIEPEQEEAAALTLARHRAPGLRGLPRATQIRRLSGALARRGYGPGLSARVVRQVLDAEDLEAGGLESAAEW